MAQDINKFLGSDEIFNKINTYFIRLDSDETKDRNQLLKVLEKLVDPMRKQSTLFDKTFQKISWCGSFYKGTRFGQPKEYDVHFVIDLRLKKKDIKFSTDQIKPGYIKIRVVNCDTKPQYINYVQNALNLDAAASKEVNSFFDDQLYLDQDSFRNWIERILSKVARETSGNDIIELPGYAPIKIRKSGPAFTLTLKHKGKDIDIDLVPVLDFSSNFLPPKKCSKMEDLLQSRSNRFWSAVPKPLSNSRGNFNNLQYRYWRLCFYEFEKDMISSHDYGRMKSVIRHLKKLRDTQGWVSVKSYFLETLCYHEKEMFHISNRRVSHTFLFFKMLEKLCDVFNNGRLRYYWDDDLNLLENIRGDEMRNMRGRLENILRSIRKEIHENPYAIARWVLTPGELDILKNGNFVETEPETESESESNQWNCTIV